MADTPLIVAVLHSGDEDKHRQLYSAAYGLEMQIDDEWHAELVLLAPHEHLNAVTEDTGVTSEDTAIVSAGVTDVPMKGGEVDISTIQHEQNNWLLVGGAASKDSEETLSAKLGAALSGDCRAILCFAEIDTGQLAKRLASIDVAALPRLVIAYVGPGASQPQVIKKAIQRVKESVESAFGKAAGCRFIVGGDVKAADAATLTHVPGVSGILLEEHSYTSFGDILRALEAVGDSENDD